jgi:hypothetical protein
MRAITKRATRRKHIKERRFTNRRGFSRSVAPPEEGAGDWKIAAP